MTDTDDALERQQILVATGIAALAGVAAAVASLQQLSASPAVATVAGVLSFSVLFVVLRRSVHGNGA